MSNSVNYINISALPIIPEIAPGDYFVVKTAAGESLIDFEDLPFVPISGGNVSIAGTLSAQEFVALTTISAASAFFTNIFVNGVSGLNVTGSFNTFTIDSGVITSAFNTESIFITNLSATVDIKIAALSAAVPVIFSDSGVVVIDGSAVAPAFSEVLIGNNNVPDNVFIEPSDIKVQYLWNTQLEDFFQTLNGGLSSLPLVYLEENTSNNYVNSNRKLQFRVIFRPALRTNARVGWSIVKVLS